MPNRDFSHLNILPFPQSSNRQQMRPEVPQTTTNYFRQ